MNGLIEGIILLANPKYNTLLTSTLENRPGVVADNLMNNAELFFWLKSKGRVKPVSGGTVLLEPIRYGDVASVGITRGYDQLNMTTSDNLTNAEYEWVEMYANAMASKREIRSNMGEQQVIDIFEEKIAAAEGALYNLSASEVYTPSTTHGGRGIPGLQEALKTPSDNGTGTFAGISRADNMWWRNQTAERATIDESNIIEVFNEVWANCILKTEKPGAAFVDTNLYLLLQNKLQQQQRFQSGQSAKAGFETLKFNTMEVFLDGGIGGSCPVNTGFVLNEKWICWKPHRQANYVAAKEDLVPIDQMAVVSRIEAMVGLTFRGLRYHGRISQTTGG